jgi:hypothetical protein
MASLELTLREVLLAESYEEAAKLLEKRIADLEATLAWYGEQARLCRLIHREGDAGRHALSSDGGERARRLLAKNE